MESPPVSGPILVVEDDEKTAALIGAYLKNDGFAAIWASDGATALELARKREPILVILDLMLPVLDGWEVCRQLRTFSDVPILILSARGEEVDRVSGLTIGADDYLVKPFSPRELVARVKAILRRGRLRAVRNANVFSHRGLVLDTEKWRVTLDGSRVSLTPHEFNLLRALMTSPGRVFSRNDLLEYLYPTGDTVVVDRVVDVHIGKLRQKIERDPANPQFILTVRGIGYQFAD